MRQFSTSPITTAPLGKGYNGELVKGCRHSMHAVHYVSLEMGV